ncbi:MAG: Spy/CpxP family protein refolding chaperone [Gammaproteobacteria bacterium]|nr:MAG: Spy/CpxP family protein refolding chaperone [Gammaproteobacteria bacterium]
MMKKNHWFVAAAVTVFLLALGPAVALHASDGVVVAQAHQHDHDKDSAKGGDDHQGSHGKDKGKAGGHGHHHGHAMKMRHDYAHVIISHTDELKLTDEQLGKIVRLHLKNKEAHEELKHRLQEDMHAFRHESMNPGGSDERLRSLAKNHIDGFNAMVEHHIKERQAIHAVLSEQQRALLKSIKADHGHDSHDDGKKKSGHGGH